MDDGIYQVVRAPYAIADYGPELVLEDAPMGVTVRTFDAGFSTGSVWRDQRHGMNFEVHPPKNSRINKIDVYVDFYGKDGVFWGNPSVYPNHSTDWIFFAHDSLEGNYWPWLGEPESTLWGITWYHPLTPPTGCLLTPFVCVDGVFYFGSATSLGNDYTTKISISYSWALNPATGGAWELTPTSDIFYGVKVTTPDTYTCGTYRIDKCYAKIYYNEPIAASSVSYKKINAIPDTEVLTQYTQAPIKADNLNFRLPYRNFIPDRTELALIKNGVLVWMGLSWNSNEVHGQEVEVLAKSQQILLDYRLLGMEYLQYPATRTIDDMLSDDTPLFIPPDPGQSVWYYYAPYNFSYRYLERTITDVYNIGFFYYLNSWKGSYGVNWDAINPAIFLAEPYYMTEYNTWPLSILEDHEVDTFIRPGTNDLGTYHFTTPPDLKGMASTVFSDLFSKLGQEVRYRYEMDGNVYQDAAIEIASGSATNPLMSFVDGQDNCRIIKKIPSDPAPSAAIGLGNNPKVSTLWKKATTWFSKVFSTSRTGPELQEYLDVQLDEDAITYEIETQTAIWHLRTGDYISVEVPDEGAKVVRIRQITTSHARTTITAGKRLTGLNEQFGVFRDARYASHTKAPVLKTSIATSNELATSTAFTVTSVNLSAGGWQCAAKIDWGFVIVPIVYGSDRGEASDYAAIYKPNSNPVVIHAYIQVAGNFSDYGHHVYQFYITRNMTAYRDVPGGTPLIVTIGQFKWRKDSGAWSEDTDGYDIWHETTEFNINMGDGLEGRVIFSCEVPNFLTQGSTNVIGKSAYVYVCQTIDLSEIGKVLILKLDGKAIPPGRFLALGNSGSMEVDITEFCDVAGTYTLTTSLTNGQPKSTSKNFYHTLGGSIVQSKYVIPLEA